jgi:hypothetical protein
MKKIKKNLLITLCTLFSLVLIWFCLAFDFRGEKILIPNNFKGNFVIYYNVKDGNELQTDGFLGRIILKIPASGVLAVKHGSFKDRKSPLNNRNIYLYDPSSGEITNRMKKSPVGTFQYHYDDIVLEVGMQFSPMEDFKEGVNTLKVEGFSIYPKNTNIQVRKNWGSLNLEETLRHRKRVY